MPVPRPASRGFTLVELLISTAVSAFVLLAIFAAVDSQQRAYSDGQRLRAAQSSARNALLFVEQRVALAGLGLAPSLAFDFGRYMGPCPGELAPCDRDAVDQPDELVFYARNPRYWVSEDPAVEPRGNAWTVVEVTGASVKVKARTGDAFPKGQVLLAVCPGAADYAFFTVATTVPALAADVPDQAIELDPVVANDPFRRQDAAVGPCYADGQARLYLVDRYRFHVRPVSVTPADVAEPFLMLDTGTDLDGDGDVDADDELVVAPGIESLQVAYDLANGTTVGATAGQPITYATTFPGATGVADQLTTLDFPGPAPEPGQTVYVPTSWYGYTLSTAVAPQRATDHQANIRHVRLSITGRSPDPERRKGGGTGDLFGLNQDARPAWAGAIVLDGYQRVRFESRVPLGNMIVRGMTYF